MAVISVSYSRLATPRRCGLELGEGPFDHPPAGSRESTGLDTLHHATPARHRESLSAPVPTPVPIRHTGWMHHCPQHQSARIDQPMARAARQVLRSVVAAAPPCSVVHTDWLSRMGAMGAGPAACRTCARNIALAHSQVPSMCHWRKEQETVCQGGYARGRGSSTRHRGGRRDTVCGACRIPSKDYFSPFSNTLSVSASRKSVRST